jgi:hypothetical protein
LLKKLLISVGIVSVGWFIGFGKRVQ